MTDEAGRHASGSTSGQHVPGDAAMYARHLAGHAPAGNPASPAAERTMRLTVSAHGRPEPEAGQPEPEAGRPGRGTARSRSRYARYGLRRHYRVAPWTDLVEVYWSADAEAYVTPVADDLVGVALLAARASGDGTRGDFETRLAAFPALARRLSDAAPAGEVRGAGPMRQDVRRRVYGRVLLVGDASGYLDALTGEGIGVGLAQAEALALCLAADRPADYERAWHRVSAPAWRLTAGLLWSRNRPLLAPRIAPAAQRLPWLFSTLVNLAASA